MQVGGLGGSHSASDHHVTNCIHDHHGTQPKTGGAAMKASVFTELSAAKAEVQAEGQFSLSDWLKNMLGNGKGFLRGFWEGGRTAAGDIAGSQAAGGEAGHGAVNAAAAGRPQAAPQATASSTHGAEAASVAVQPPVRAEAGSPSYFAAEDTENHKQALWQKVKVRFRHLSGQLGGRLPKKFFGFQTKNPFQPRQGNTKDDLRRHGRPRKDTVEIESVLAGDSYLMDSYDRSGGYSKLTTKK